MKVLLFLFLPFFIPQYFSSGLKNACKYKLDENPVVRIDDHIQGIWKLQEDTDAHNYFIVEKDGDYQYVLTYMNRSGDNRGLEHGLASFEEVDHVKFLTLYNWDRNYPGYIFLKIKDINKGSWDVTAALVTDPSVAKVRSSAELRSLFKKNLDNPAFYGKDLHFRKKFEFNSFGGK